MPAVPSNPHWPDVQHQIQNKPLGSLVFPKEQRKHEHEMLLVCPLTDVTRFFVFLKGKKSFFITFIGGKLRGRVKMVQASHGPFNPGKDFRLEISPL